MVYGLSFEGGLRSGAAACKALNGTLFNTSRVGYKIRWQPDWILDAPALWLVLVERDRVCMSALLESCRKIRPTRPRDQPTWSLPVRGLIVPGQ